MAKLLPIITNPSPILRKKSEKIDKKELSSTKLQELCLDMTKTMKEKDGLGLAAPQVGQNIRLIVINTQDGPICLINPKITKRSWAKEKGEEGCLSVPGMFGEVKRHKKIDCLYFGAKGKQTKMQANGLLARVVQHEIDHLDGILFIDKAKNVKKVDLV